MSDRYEIIPASNPIDKDRKPPMGVIAFKNKAKKKNDPEREAVNVVLMGEQGEPREARKKQILNYFPDNSPEGARAVEKLVDHTTGFTQSQMNSLLNYMRLKDFRDQKTFFDALNEGVKQAWLDDL
jgi:hypothetical protein